MGDFFNELFGDEVEIRIHRLDEIPKDPSGKFRFIINNIKA